MCPGTVFPLLACALDKETASGYVIVSAFVSLGARTLLGELKAELFRGGSAGVATSVGSAGRRFGLYVCSLASISLFASSFLVGNADIDLVAVLGFIPQSVLVTFQLM